MRIGGCLAQGDVYTILRLLGRTRSCGLLRLHTNGREATLAVRCGRVLRAAVGSAPSPGQAVVRGYPVDPTAIEQALMVHHGPSPRSAAGGIEESEPCTALTEGIRDVIELSATWTAASYEFEPQGGADRDAALCGGVTISSLTG